MRLFISFLIFNITLVVFTIVWQIAVSDRRKIEKRLALISRQEQTEVEDDDLNKPFKERILQPFFKTLSSYLSRLMPKTHTENLKEKLEVAGTPFNLKPHEFMTVQYVFAAIILMIFLLYAKSLGMGNKNIIIISPAVMYAGFKLPILYLRILSKKRQKSIDRSLPDVIDLLTVSVEAGLGFDAALAKVTQKTKGILAGEFSKALYEIKMGKSRREALKDIVKRTESEDLANFISSIIQADGLGVSMGHILRIQSQQMRRKRRQRAEEEAMKVPVKMLVPMVLFIFPCIFIVLLGPAAIRIFNELVVK